jgi:hypothetical protein
MPKIPPTQITLPLAPFAEVSSKSERQVRKDLAEGKYKSVAGGGRHTILIDTEIAAGIASQRPAFTASSFQSMSTKAFHRPQTQVKSISYNDTRTKPWSRSHRDCHHVAVATCGRRLMSRLMH